MPTDNKHSLGKVLSHLVPLSQVTLRAHGWQHRTGAHLNNRGEHGQMRDRERSGHNATPRPTNCWRADKSGITLMRFPLKNCKLQRQNWYTKQYGCVILRRCICVGAFWQSDHTIIILHKEIIFPLLWSCWHTFQLR